MLEAPQVPPPPALPLYIYIYILYIRSLDQVSPPRYFANVSIITPVVSALKNYILPRLLEVPAGVLSRFWIQVYSRFRSETVTNLYYNGCM